MNLVKTIIITIALIIFTTGCGDKTINETETIEKDDLIYEINAKEAFTGIMQSFHENGKLELQVEHKNGQLDGLLKNWYENGKQESEINYKNGQEHGLFKDWYENGKLKSEEEYVNGKKVGDGIYYDESGGLLITKGK